MVAFYIVYRFGIWLRQDVALIAMVPVPRAVDPDSAAILGYPAFDRERAFVLLNLP